MSFSLEIEKMAKKVTEKMNKLPVLHETTEMSVKQAQRLRKKREIEIQEPPKKRRRTTKNPKKQANITNEKPKSLKEKCREKYGKRFTDKLYKKKRKRRNIFRNKQSYMKYEELGQLQEERCWWSKLKKEQAVVETSIFVKELMQSEEEYLPGQEKAFIQKLQHVIVDLRSENRNLLTEKKECEKKQVELERQLCTAQEEHAFTKNVLEKVTTQKWQICATNRRFYGEIQVLNQEIRRNKDLIEKKIEEKKKLITGNRLLSAKKNELKRELQRKEEQLQKAFWKARQEQEERETANDLLELFLLTEDL